MSYANKLKDDLYWWLNSKRPFIVNDEYKIELLFIDNNNHSVKIKVTNLKTSIVTEETVEVPDGQD